MKILKKKKNILFIDNKNIVMNEMNVIQLNNITDFNIDDVSQDTVFIFDIDDTLITHNISGTNGYVGLTDDRLPYWMNEIYKRKIPIICLTARYYPNNEEKSMEMQIFRNLGLYHVTIPDSTKNNKLENIVYTNSELKGPYAKEIMKYYSHLGYNKYIFFDDRPEQIQSVLSMVPGGRGVYIVK